jgi:hypothetical protein
LQKSVFPKFGFLFLELNFAHPDHGVWYSDFFKFVVATMKKIDLSSTQQGELAHALILTIINP